MEYEARLNELGIKLPEAPKPVAAYVPGIKTGKLLFISGQLPVKEGKLLYSGRVGQDITVEQGQEAARLALINALAVVKSLVGSLERVEQVVRLTGYVQAKEGFYEIPQVVNGASELLLQVFGDAGRHSRVAVGVSNLPLGAPVEVEMIVSLRE